MKFVPTDISAPLLLLSRASLSRSEMELARQLCTQVSDWKLLTSISIRKFSLPFVYRNLLLIFPDGSGDIDLEMMRQEVLPIKMMALKVLAAQVKFHKLCIQQIKCQHVYLKGPSLAARYFNDAGVRFSRDVDVLVPEHALEPVVREAISNGYRIVSYNPYGTIVTDEGELKALMRYEPVVTLLSYDNVLIEVHKQVDKSLGIFRSCDLLLHAKEQLLGDVHIKVLPTEMLFSFTCYHNTRHTWSRLHWLADLDAMISHQSFELDKVQEYASKIGMRATVDACIELNNLSKSVSANLLDSGPLSHGAELLKLCLKNLSGDNETEHQLRLTQNIFGLPFYWLLSWPAGGRAILHRLQARLVPSYYQFEAWPLPDHWQWLYYITKPYFALRRRLETGGS